MTCVVFRAEQIEQLVNEGLKIQGTLECCLDSQLRTNRDDLRNNLEIPIDLSITTLVQYHEG